MSPAPRSGRAPLAAATTACSSSGGTVPNVSRVGQLHWGPRIHCGPHWNSDPGPSCSGSTPPRVPMSAMLASDGIHRHSASTFDFDRISAARFPTNSLYRVMFPLRMPRTALESVKNHLPAKGPRCSCTLVAKRIPMMAPCSSTRGMVMRCRGVTRVLAQMTRASCPVAVGQSA